MGYYSLVIWCKRLLAFATRLSNRVAKGGFLSRTYHAHFLEAITHHRKIKKYIFNYITRILLSFDLGKSEVKERQKRARSWCHNYLFLMSLLLVSNDILNQHGSFKGKSRVKLLCSITPHAANFGPITQHADNLGPITRYGKTPLPL